MPNPKIGRKMVCWYDPSQLLKTGVDVAISAALGTRVDYRGIEALAVTQESFDYSHNNELWIDYVADLGDGWDSTYTIANLLAREKLDFTHDSQRGEPYQTRRGNILIMGGDEVYPTASREEYQRRLVTPYEHALRQTNPPHPHLFAIPGNHDWYDGLTSFMRLFCQQRWIGGWQTRQTRSYFALKLPHGWWLLGVDIQLESDIDWPQIRYFQDELHNMGMKQGDRVILCTAEPDWIYGNIYDRRLQTNLAYLERKVIQPAGGRVVVKLAGDLHHYRRHESLDGPRIHLITAGGGGAFLHPTHGEMVDSITLGEAGQQVVFTLREEFPKRKTSFWLTFRNLAFPWHNPKFGLVTGIIYTILAWVMPHRLYNFEFGFGNLWTAVRISCGDLLRTPSGMVWALVVIGAFLLFTDTHRKYYRYCAGSLHALGHLFAALIITWGVSRFTVSYLNWPVESAWRLLFAGGGIFVGGYLAGSLLMGLYLLVSLNMFGRHSNEAFSSLRIPDWKNCLRLKIDAAGTLTIFPIGIRRVPRHWRNRPPGQAGPEWISDDRKATPPELIEPPIVLS